MTSKERKARENHHLYETCEGITGHVKRIVALEELALDMLKALEVEDKPYREYGLRPKIRAFRERMKALDINLDK